MAYVRKTKDVYVLQGNYGGSWEDLFEEDTRAEAYAQLKTYDREEPKYEHRIVHRRVGK